MKFQKGNMASKMSYIIINIIMTLTVVIYKTYGLYNIMDQCMYGEVTDSMTMALAISIWSYK